MNQFKTYFFLALLTALFILVGWTLGGKTGATYALILAAMFNLITYWLSDKIILKMYRARKVAPGESPELYEIVGELTNTANLPMPKIYMIQSESPNAFATGRNPQNAAVAVTTGIMGLLSREELKGVIGHELSHIKYRDILIGTVAATIAGAFLCRDPHYLANALRKLETGAKRIPLEANPSTAHLFIVNPLRGRGIMNLFSTHPPIQERIKKLEEMTL